MEQHGNGSTNSKDRGRGGEGDYVYIQAPDKDRVVLTWVLFCHNTMVTSTLGLRLQAFWCVHASGVRACGSTEKPRQEGAPSAFLHQGDIGEPGTKMVRDPVG